MRTNNIKLAIAGASVAVLAACGSPPTHTSSNSIPVTTTTSSIPVTTTTASTATGYGVVQAIDVVPREQSGIGVGTVAGAVVGGLLGNQVGSGSGRAVATVAGAAGGAYAGRAVERNTRAGGEVYRVAVRMDNGTVQTMAQEVPPGVQIGERVRLDNGVIVERFR